MKHKLNLIMRNQPLMQSSAHVQVVVSNSKNRHAKSSQKQHEFKKKIKEVLFPLR